MKRVVYLSLLLSLCVAFVSCKDQKESKEWESFYGYTVEDIIGEYGFSNLINAFDGLTESDYCHICDDAEISVVALTNTSVQFNFNCAGLGFDKSFMGRPTLNDNDFLIRMATTLQYQSGKLKDYQLTSYVYRNANQDLRLHGYVTENIYEADTVLLDRINYYFDVIKH